MIRFILFRFWPALLPLIVYLIWHAYKVKAAKKVGVQPPRFRDGPIYWMIIACFALAAGCFLVLALEIEPQKGHYVPPMMRDGKLIPGHVE